MSLLHTPKTEVERLEDLVSNLRHRVTQLQKTNSQVTKADIMGIASDCNVGDLFVDVHMAHDLMHFAMCVAGHVQRQNDPWIVRVQYTNDPWIPFSEAIRLPKDNTQILFRDPEGNVGIGWFCEEDVDEWFGDWMAIPKQIC